MYTEEEILQGLRELSEESEEDGFSNEDDVDFELEQIEEDDHCSNSSQSITSEEIMDDDSRPTSMEENMRFYLGKDFSTIWANNPQAVPSKTKSKNIIKTFPGPKGPARESSNELESFLNIISLDMIDNIVKYTNIYIAKKRAENIQTSRPRDYSDTSRSEIMALLGVLFLIAVKKGNRTNVLEMWSTDGTGMTILRANFSSRRFLFLMRAIRLDDITTRSVRQTTDKLAAVREFHSSFVANCQNSYHPGEFVTIDEMLVAFRGRCGFVQYMPQKPAKYGLKFYAMCDSRTFYTFNMEIYSGKQKEGPFFNSNKPMDIVKRLIVPIKRSHRNLTTDNYYSSIPLAEYLLGEGLTFLGTLKKNKREIPPEFLMNPSRPVGSSMFGFQPDFTLVSYVTKKKKAVLLLSSMHDTDETDPETQKPVVILDYNRTKGGVDTVDQLCSTYSTARKTRRWPMVVFFRELDIAGINSFKIFLANNPTKICTRRKYLTDLAMQLMDEHLRVRAKLWCLPKDISCFLSKYRESPSVTKPVSQKKICYLCGTHKNTKTGVTCHICCRNVCKNHSQHKVTCEKCNELGNSEDSD
jgi:hypothetical protein